MKTVCQHAGLAAQVHCKAGIVCSWNIEAVRWTHISSVIGNLFSGNRLGLRTAAIASCTQCQHTIQLDNAIKSGFKTGLALQVMVCDSRICKGLGGQHKWH